MSNLFNEAAFDEVFGAQLHHQLVQAAESVIQAAIKEAEAEMRKALAVAVVGMIQKNYSVQRMGHDLVITVRMQTQGA
ncbi:hypothetical protein ACOTHJ_21395 [Achromobacter xylosoxidans]